MKKIVLLFLCISILSACGKRGKLEFPEGSTYPRQYPAARQPEYGGMKKKVSTGAERIPAVEEVENSGEQSE